MLCDTLRTVLLRTFPTATMRPQRHAKQEPPPQMRHAWCVLVLNPVCERPRVCSCGQIGHPAERGGRRPGGRFRAVAQLSGQRSEQQHRGRLDARCVRVCRQRAPQAIGSAGRIMQAFLEVHEPAVVAPKQSLGSEPGVSRPRAAPYQQAHSNGWNAEAGRENAGIPVEGVLCHSGRRRGCRREGAPSAHCRPRACRVSGRQASGSDHRRHARAAAFLIAR